MDIRELFERLSLLKKEKIAFDEFKDSFANTLYVAGTTLDSQVLDFLSTLNLDNITKILILTPYSNLDKSFTTSWRGLSKFIGDKNIELKMKAPKEKIPSDIYFISNDKIYFIPKIYFSKNIKQCCICKNFDIKDKILKAFASSEDFSTFKGSEIYYAKYNVIFEIDKRNLGDNEKEKILEALWAWENSGFEDIEPLWRIFESKIRNFIQIRLKDDSGNWFTSKVLSCFEKQEIIDAIHNRFDKNKERLEISDIDDHPFPVEYLVAENYETIIMNSNNSSYFSDYKSNENNGRVRKQLVRDVIKGRNPSIHARTLDSDSDLYSDLIIKALLSMEWLNELEPGLMTMT